MIGTSGSRRVSDYHARLWRPWTDFFDAITADPDYEVAGGEWVPDPQQPDDRAYDRWIVWVRRKQNNLLHVREKKNA